MDLRQYEQAKFALAEILRSAATLVKADHDGELADQFQNLFARLAEDRFNLAFIGRFSRGKSSLMNAILGTDRLPTGIVPLTSVITTVSYGTNESVILRYRGRHLDIPISIDELPRYITQEGNPGNALGIATANIELPAQILRRGFYFVDTPGLGSTITENTQTTESFLPEVDALVLVTSYESPLSEEELRALQTVARDIQVFVVINKQDLVSEAERQQAEDFVRGQLRTHFGDTAPEVFSVSARDAIAAKLARDRSRLESSGMPAFEARLSSFLVDHKQGQFLTRMCDRVRSLLQGFLRTDGIADLLGQIDAMARTIGDRSEGTSVPPKPAETPFSVRQLRSCEICAEVDDALWEFLRRYQYQLVADDDERERFARRSGFCPFHTWEYRSIASPYGTCVGFPPLFDRLASQLREAAATGRVDAPIPFAAAVRLSGHDDCALCTIRDEAEARAIGELAARLRKRLEETLSGLSAVCLPHVAMLAAVLEDDPAVLGALTAHHADLLERVAEDMRSFTLKHNAVRRNLETKEERTAAERALVLIAGLRNVNFAAGAHAEADGNRARPVRRRKGAGVDAVKPGT